MWQGGGLKHKTKMRQVGVAEQMKSRELAGTTHAGQKPPGIPREQPKVTRDVVNARSGDSRLSEEGRL